MAVLSWIWRIPLLVVLFDVFFILGALAVAGEIPDIKSEPGMVSTEVGVVIIGVANTLLVTGLVLSSGRSGWKLASLMALSYYGAVTFMTQIETWYFLSGLTVSRLLLPRLFLMGIPVALFFVPLAVWICGRGRNDSTPSPGVTISLKQWVWKLPLLAILYVILYWSAGYFIAWQNPELRAFYGSPGEAMPFWTHTADSIHTNPGLFPFQIVRGLLWTLCALPVIRGSKVNVWWTAILVGALLSVPQNIGHILANPLLPLASVRLSHMIETASSTFLFGLIVTRVLYRNHTSVRDIPCMKQEPIR